MAANGLVTRGLTVATPLVLHGLGRPAAPRATVFKSTGSGGHRSTGSGGFKSTGKAG